MGLINETFGKYHWWFYYRDFTVIEKGNFFMKDVLMQNPRKIEAHLCNVQGEQ